MQERTRGLVLVACAVALILAGCESVESGAQEKEFSQRIGSLYTHTRIMLDLTSDEDAAAIGLRPGEFREASAPLDRLAVLERTMGLDAGGSLEERVLAAERRMAEMMVLWEGTPSARR